MRWQALFDDLEAQVEAADSAELYAEVRDRTRREAALLRTTDRLAAAVGQHLTAVVQGAGRLTGAVQEAGDDWLLLAEAPGRELLVPLPAVLSVAGLGRASGPAGGQDELRRRLDLRYVLRGLARGRVGVQVVLLDGTTTAGTVDRVGADHLDLAEHGSGEARRASAVQRTVLLPLAALAVVRQIS